MRKSHYWTNPYKQSNKHFITNIKKKSRKRKYVIVLVQKKGVNNQSCVKIGKCSATNFFLKSNRKKKQSCNKILN